MADQDANDEDRRPTGDDLGHGPESTDSHHDSDSTTDLKVNPQDFAVTVVDPPSLTSIGIWQDDQGLHIPNHSIDSYPFLPGMIIEVISQPPPSQPQPHDPGPSVNPEETPYFPQSPSISGSQVEDLDPEWLRLTQDGLTPAMALLNEVQGDIAERSKGGAGEKKKKKPKKKKKTEEKKEKVQKICSFFQKSGRCRYGHNCKFSHALSDTLPPPDDKVEPTPPEKVADSPMDLFFAKYPEFEYMRNKPLWNEFDRLCEDLKFGEPKRYHVKGDFRNALVEEFNHVYGTDEGDLECWRKLCKTMGLSTPTTLAKAHKLVRGAHINLVVLVQSPRTCEPVQVFKNIQDLRNFTAETSWTFPCQHNKAGGLLNALLRKIGDPSHGYRHRGKKASAE
ncbi:hypothetical protein ACHAPT_002645 [Fusarium lateritium]